MKKRVFTSCFILGLLFLGCSSKEQKTTDRTVIVKVDTVKSRNNELLISYPGKIKASDDIDIAFQVSGTIQKVYVDAGSKVSKGDLLASLNPTDYQIQLSATQAEYKKIKGDAERIISLYEKGSVSKSNYEKAIYGLEQITAKLKAHKKALADTHIRAPFDGYVQKKYFNANETVAAGYPILSFFNQNVLEATINIPSSDYQRRNQFESFYCTTNRDPQAKYPLKLISINQKANLNQLYTVRLGFLNKPELTLPTPGMTTTIYIKCKAEETQLTVIPLSSIKKINGKSSVWVYDKGIINAREIKLMEIKRNGLVTVSEGLSPGEIIVSAGVNSLKENQKVRVIQPTTKTNKGGLL